MPIPTTARGRALLHLRTLASGAGGSGENAARRV